MDMLDRMRHVEPDRRDEIILEAARRSTPVVLTRREERNWTSHKAHFQGADDSRTRLTITACEEILQARGGPPVRGERIGVAFRRGHRKCMFSAVIEDVQAADTLVVKWPDQIQELQRRAYYRVSPPRGITLPVRFWVPEGRPHGALAQPPENAWIGTVIDLSAGGMRISCRENPSLELGQTVLCHFAHKRGAPPLSVEASLRHRQPGDRSEESLGLQFIGLETTSTGQKCLVRLAKIVSEFQQSNYRASRRPRQPELAGRDS
jgi:hypothetical protein